MRLLICSVSKYLVCRMAACGILSLVLVTSVADDGNENVFSTANVEL